MSPHSIRGLPLVNPTNSAVDCPLHGRVERPSTGTDSTTGTNAEWRYSAADTTDDSVLQEFPSPAYSPFADQPPKRAPASAGTNYAPLPFFP